MGLIGSAIGAAGSIFGGIAASKAMRKMKEKKIYIYNRTCVRTYVHVREKFIS